MIWIGLYAVVGLVALVISFRLSFTKSVNENNSFGPDPLKNTTLTNPSYWFIVIVLLILWFLLDLLWQNQNTTELTAEEKKELQKYMNDFWVDEWSWSISTSSSEDGILDRLSGVQERTQDVAKMWDLQQISTALSMYDLDKNIYPVYTSFIDVSQLSPYLSSEYLKDIPMWDWYIYYYKSLEQGSWFVLMVEVSSWSTNSNFFGLQSDIENKSLVEINQLIENPINNGWKSRYVLTN